MAYETPGFSITLEAGADLSTQQYRFVKLDGNGRVIAIAAATDKPIGILQDKPAALGRAAEVMTMGVSKLSMDAAVALPAAIGPSADGQGAAKVAGTDITHYIVGQLLKASGAAGEISTVAFDCLNAGRGA